MGIKCLLVSTNQTVIPYPVYPLGTAHLAGALESAGHKAYLFDLMSHGGIDKLGERIREISPDLIGISLRNVDTVDSTAPETFMADALETMEVIRRNTKAPVVVGGPAFSIFPEEFMGLLEADYGIVGEGEILFPHLADRVKQGELPERQIYRADFKEVPWRPVQYDRDAVSFYLRSGGMLNMQTKRGCPFQCNYCSYPCLEGRQLRYRDPEDVAEEVQRLSRDLGVKYIFFTDVVFNDPQGRYLEVAEALVRIGNKTPWCAFFRPKGLTRDSLELLKASGLAAMELGTDAASDTTLDGLRKGFTFDDVVKTNELAVSLKIPCAHFVVFGGPGENRKTVEEGLHNIEKLRSSVVFAFSGIRILPGTGIYSLAVREGVIQKDQSIFQPVFYFSSTISQEELDSLLRQAWSGRFDRIYPCSLLHDRISFLHKRGHLGPMWDALIMF